jgi:hypothetical protein
MYFFVLTMAAFSKLMGSRDWRRVSRTQDLQRGGRYGLDKAQGKIMGQTRGQQFRLNA